jgi:ribosome-associated translation inhibitor RaiA
LSGIFLQIDDAGTAKLRAALAGQKSVKITITIDGKSLRLLKHAARKTGVPYQTLVIRALANAAAGQGATDSRLDRLERELKRMKRMLVA